MEKEQFRVVIRARNFDRSCRFYGETLTLPRLQHWERDDGSGALFQAATAVIEIRGRPRSARPDLYDEVFDREGPWHKVSFEFLVPSAEQAYQELLFRDKNIPGGLREDTDGSLIFETHDPDGIRIIYRQIKN